MKPVTQDIKCLGYSVKTDIYEGRKNGPVMLVLIGRTSRRTKKRYYHFLSILSDELGITSLIFDYSGHGDSPFDIDNISPAQHFLEVITVFDWIKENYSNQKIFIYGSSYGGYLATQLTKYRRFDALILRAPAMYIPQDFYTIYKNENVKERYKFRQDSQALAKHPLLARDSKFEGKVLLIVHKNDDDAPKETTDAYANAFKPDIINEKNIGHSLNNASKEQLDAYNQKIINWLKNNFNL